MFVCVLLRVCVPVRVCVCPQTLDSSLFDGIALDQSVKGAPEAELQDQVGCVCVCEGGGQRWCVERVDGD